MTAFVYDMPLDAISGEPVINMILCIEHTHLARYYLPHVFNHLFVISSRLLSLCLLFVSAHLPSPASPYCFWQTLAECTLIQQRHGCQILTDLGKVFGGLIDFG